MTTLPTRADAHDLAADTAVFTEFLQRFGLPTDNIIASTVERRIVAGNLPHFLDSLSADEKRDARYLSKVVGATAIGLFDAALNYVWNEVVINLRKKAIVYGLELFFDASVGSTSRASYKTEEDLAGLKDSVLLDTCRKLELVSDVVHRKLHHILTMRNEVAASHPNVESIGGYELLGWLQTCVRDVIQDRPSESAIRIKSLLDSLRASTTVISGDVVSRFQAEVPNLATAHANNLTITLFGMFCAHDSDQILRKNISLIAKPVWLSATEQVKYRVGAMIDGYRTNLQQERLQRASEFLGIVDGRRYESLPARTVALQTLADKLAEAHFGHDNFWHEPPIMEELLSYCARSSDIPRELLPRLVLVVLRCRLGRGLSYRRGVSPNGLPLYDRFLAILDDFGIKVMLETLFDSELNWRLQNSICQEHLGPVLIAARAITISDRLKEVIDFLARDIPNVWRANERPDFRDLASGLTGIK